MRNVLERKKFEKEEEKRLRRIMNGNGVQAPGVIDLYVEQSRYITVG